MINNISLITRYLCFYSLRVWLLAATSKTEKKSKNYSALPCFATGWPQYLIGLLTVRAMPSGQAAFKVFTWVTLASPSPPMTGGQKSKVNGQMAQIGCSRTGYSWTSSPKKGQQGKKVKRQLWEKQGSAKWKKEQLRAICTLSAAAVAWSLVAAARLYSRNNTAGRSAGHNQEGRASQKFGPLLSGGDGIVREG